MNVHAWGATFCDANPLTTNSTTASNPSHFDEALPAFLTIAAMPFTYSIANGIVLGIVSYVLIKAASGRMKEVSPILAVLAALLTVYYATIGH